VCAGRRQRRDPPIVVAVGCDALAAKIDDPALAALQFPERGGIRAGDPIPHHVVGVVDVFLDVVPRAATDLRSADVEQFRPRVLQPQGGISRHHPGQRAESRPVAGEAGSGELT
jgi:hypothetical protein